MPGVEGLGSAELGLGAGAYSGSASRGRLQSGKIVGGYRVGMLALKPHPRPSATVPSAAKTAGAKDMAIYEYTAAVEYLQKAREENAYSDYAAARLYADKALDYAVKARERAETVSQIDQPMVLPPQ